MGDRNPKSIQKQAMQKQTKTNDANQKRRDVIATQQAAKAKLAAKKK